MGNNIDLIKKSNVEGILIYCGIIGNANIGKRSIARKYTKGLFQNDIVMSLGYEYFYKRIRVNNQKYHIGIFVGGNQDKYVNLMNSTIKNALFGILVYDITDADSFNDLNFWIENTKNLYDDINWILI